MTTLSDELRKRYTGLDPDKSRAAAVKLFCVECMGGSAHEAARCTTRECFLWPHAFGRAQTAANAKCDAEAA